MERRRWEDLNTDCVVNIFGRLELESRLLDVPYVCKQWHRALLNPLCWQTLVFPEDVFLSRIEQHILSARHDIISKLIKFVVDRSQGCATEIVLPDCAATKDLMIYVSYVCPNLKVLSLAYLEFSIDEEILAELIVKWKSLEILKVKELGYNMEKIIDAIGSNCKSFVGLYVSDSVIGYQVAEAIVSKLVTIKMLVLDNNHIQKENLGLILQGCKQLEVLHVRRCEGFDEDDEAILDLASHIKDFCCDGSKTSMNNSDEWEDFCDYDDFGYSSDMYDNYGEF